MASTALDAHDNNEFFRQQKMPIGEVIQLYNIPVPVKLRHAGNLKTVQEIAASYGVSQRINDFAAMRLIYNANKDNATLTPIAYYVIHPKTHNFDDRQADAILSLLTPAMQLHILKRISTLDQVISTLDDKTVDYIADLILLDVTQASVAADVVKTTRALPIALKREALTFLPDNIKNAVIQEIMKPQYALSFLNRKQKDMILGELLLPAFPASENMNKFKVALALQKYPESMREGILKNMPAEAISRVLREFFVGQFVEGTPNIIMLFLDGEKRDLRKYSKVIEDAAARNELEVPQTPELKSFFEKIVTLNVNTHTRLATLHPGLQSEAVLLLPEITQGNVQIGARIVVINGQNIVDLGDSNNTLYSQEKPGGGYELQVELSDVYKGMHQVCHALKLNHKDEMFFNPEELKARKAIMAIKIPGMDEPSFLLSNGTMEQGVLGHGKANSAARAA